jgi:Uma2 family endonuclease
MSIDTITPQPTEVPSWPLYRMTLEQYEAMVESGIFTERDKLQLINGILVAKVTQGDDHCVADDLCRNGLSAVTPRGWFVRSNKPILLPPDGAPEPDEAVIRGSTRDYARGKKGKPGAADVALVVEIAQSSVAADREMIAVYGRAGIPVYWIINLVERQVEVYSGPHAGGYAKCEVYGPGSIVPVVIDGHVVGQIAVDDLLP